MASFVRSCLKLNSQIFMHLSVVLLLVVLLETIKKGVITQFLPVNLLLIVVATSGVLFLFSTHKSNR